MKPYYDEKGIRIFFGDSRDVMPGLIDAGETFDICTTDTPFSPHTHANIRGGEKKGVKRKTMGREISKAKKLDFTPYTAEDLRDVLSLVHKFGVRWVIAKIDIEHRGHVKLYPPRGLKFIRDGIWLKPNAVPQMSGDRPSQGFEYLAIFHRLEHRGHMKWNGGGRPAVWTHNVVEKARYETESPLGLYQEWIRDFATPAGALIDPHMGSGTALEAAASRGHPAVGIDISEKACEVAAKRLRAFFKQGVLFLPVGKGGSEKAQTTLL